MMISMMLFIVGCYSLPANRGQAQATPGSEHNWLPVIVNNSTSITVTTQLDPKCLGKDATFQPFISKLKVYCDSVYMYIEANDLPDHEMMVSITAWNQQVPVPQDFFANNAWRIPLSPTIASQTTPTIGTGPIAVANNGVMIYNPTKQDGIYSPGSDPYLIGELDHCGGHSGRADDYHYHIAPNCVIADLVVDTGSYTLPIAYALDGFAIYSYTDADGNTPSDLDSCNGHTHGNLGYHYHATKTYPYMNGCFKGYFDVSLQPHTTPIRTHGEPINTLITAFYVDKEGWSHLEYQYQNVTKAIVYIARANSCFDFKLIEDISQSTPVTPTQYCRAYNPPPRNRSWSSFPWLGW